MRELVDGHYPDAACVRVVQDNLSTHSAGALYEAFAPAEARRILPPPRIPLHPQNMPVGYHGRDRDWRAARPVPGSANRRPHAPHQPAWEQQRSAASARIKWMFTTEKARAKMGRISTAAEFPLLQNISLLFFPASLKKFPASFAREFHPQALEKAGQLRRVFVQNVVFCQKFPAYQGFCHLRPVRPVSRCSAPCIRRSRPPEPGGSDSSAPMPTTTRSMRRACDGCDPRPDR